MNMITKKEAIKMTAAYAEAACQSDDPNQRYPGFKGTAEMQMQMNRFEALIEATRMRNGQQAGRGLRGG